MFGTCPVCGAVNVRLFAVDAAATMLLCTDDIIDARRRGVSIDDVVAVRTLPMHADRPTDVY